jgi:hypothetical protein
MYNFVHQEEGKEEGVVDGVGERDLHTHSLPPHPLPSSFVLFCPLPFSLLLLSSSLSLLGQNREGGARWIAVPMVDRPKRERCSSPAQSSLNERTVPELECMHDASSNSLFYVCMYTICFALPSPQIHFSLFFLSSFPNDMLSFPWQSASCPLHELDMYI